MRILIVDDEAAVANFCRAALTEAGHLVVTAGSGRKALALLEEHEFDLVLSDVMMPGMSGVELLRSMAPVGHRPDVVLMTGYGTVATAVEAIKAGAHDYILKPVSSDELAAMAARIAEARDLRAENQMLRFKLAAEEGTGMIGTSAAMLTVFDSILRVAPRRHPVLITGETGTGKEMVARAIHQNGSNPGGPFVAVDCGALPHTLLDSELFGHVRGAFTGASHERPGLLATSSGGTLFLDEIGELPLDVQSRLFRVLQEREFRPLGSDAVRKFEARIVAATDRNLEEAMEGGTFRPELYFRLNVHHIHVPPLRAHKSDIPALLQHFIRKHGERQTIVISAEAMQELEQHDWPGNVRELENTVLHMIAESDDGALGRDHLPVSLLATHRKGKAAGSPLEEAERAAIESALRTCDWNVAEAARRLNISKATLYRKIERYGVVPERPGKPAGQRRA